MIVHWKAGVNSPASAASKTRRAGSRRRPSLRPRTELLEGRLVLDSGGGWSALAGGSPPPVQVSSSPTTRTFIQEAKLTSPVAGADLRYGWGASLTADGETLAIGAPGNGSVPGAVYLYARDQRVWTETARLAAPEGVPDDRFGHGVAISGDGGTLAVTSLEGEWGTGGASLHVYHWSGAGWELAQTLTLDVSAGFGGWLSISEDGGVIVGGAASDEEKIGAVYVFSRTDGVYAMDPPIVPPDGRPGDYFGEPTALSGDGRTLAVGFSRGSSAEFGFGGVLVYERSGSSWVLATTLRAPNSSSRGPKVALNGDGSVLLTKGSSWDEASGLRVFQGLIFTRSGSDWLQTAELIDPEPSLLGSYGEWVALSPDGDTAVVSAPWRTIEGSANQGAAYVFARSGSDWTQTARLTASDGTDLQLFGYQVAVRNHTIAVAAPATTVGTNPGQGAVYIFHDPQGFAVIADPADRTGRLQTVVMFTAAARGAESIATQWQVSTDAGATWSDVAGATSPQLSFVPTLADSGNLYRAVFIDGEGTTLVTRAAALSVVKAAPVVTIASGVNPSRYYEALTFAVRVASDGLTPSVPDGGTVELTIGSFRASAVVRGGQATIQVPPETLLKPGYYEVAATYDGAGDPVFGSAAGSLLQVVRRAETAIEAWVGADGPYYGQSGYIFAQVAQVRPILDFRSGPSGFATFENFGGLLGSTRLQPRDHPSPLEPVITVIPYKFDSLDPLSIVVYYSGDEWNEPAVSAPLAVSVAPASTQTVAYVPDAYTYYGLIPSVEVHTSTAYGERTTRGRVSADIDGDVMGPIDVRSQDGLARPAFWYLEAGGHVANFTFYSPQGFYLPSTASIGVAVYKAPTSVTLASSKPASAEGEVVEFTATVTNVAAGDLAKAGVVHFYVGAALVATVPVDELGQARVATTALVPGVYTLTAVYEESKNYQASQSEHLVQRVEPPSRPRSATSATLTTSAPSSVAGVEVTFTATVAGSGGVSHPTSGRVAFYIGGALVAYAAVGSDGLARLATSALVPGSYTVSAVFEESADFRGSQSATISQLVLATAEQTRGATTTTTLTSTANPASPGRSLTFLADVAAGASRPTSGTVRFYLGLEPITERPVDANGRASLEARFDAPGGYLITAVYLGADGFATSQSEHLGQVVPPPAAALAVPPPIAQVAEPVLVVTPWAARRAARAERMARLALRRPPAMRGRD